MPLAGETIYASDVPIPKSVVKLTTESVTSSTTLQNDDELFLDFAATGVTYWVEARIGCFGAAAGDIKIAWLRTGTLTAMSNRLVLGPQLATTDITATLAKMAMGFALTTAVPYGLDGVGNGAVVETFILRVDVAGRLTMQWSQNTSSATATTVNTGSSLIAIPVA